MAETHNYIQWQIPKILKGGGAEDNVSALLSFIANAHNTLYTFYMVRKSDLLEKILMPIGEQPCHCLTPPPPFNAPLIITLITGIPSYCTVGRW